MVRVIMVLKGERAISPASNMTSWSTRPPGFVECYVCHREFGSRSIEIHEPQCLDKWRAQNARLPKDRREATPSPPPDHPLHRAQLQADMVPSPAAYTPTSDPDELSSSWPDPRQPPSRRVVGRTRSASLGQGGKKTRPSTATLKRPKVLDVNLKNAVDMSEMTRSMVDQLILSRDQQSGSSDYSSDFTSSSPSSMGSKSPFDDSGDSEGEPRRMRPSTMRLPRPSRNIAVPVITSSSSRPTKKTSSLRNFIPRGRRRHLEEVFMGPRNKVKIPEPCQTCGKEENPERFHSHPLHMQRFKPKLEDRGKARNTSKMVVTKPTALKFKSRTLDEDKKAANKKNKLRPPQGGHRKSHSVDSSPSLAKKAEDRGKKVHLKKFMQNQKASIGKGRKDFNVEIYEGDIALTPRSENGISPLSERKREVTLKQNGDSGRGVANQRASHPPRTMGKIEEEGESGSESRSNTGSSRTNKQATTPSAPTLVCYICGREFGSRSLPIHQPQCLEKWKRENERLPKHRQRPLPQEPTGPLTHDEWNEYAWKTAQAQLVPCEWCGRTFFPERLEVHQRGCKPPPGAAKKTQRNRPDSSGTLFNASLNVAKPTVVCYICGREFGTMSISIHEPQCLRKWKLQNDNLPASLQRPEPRKPEPVYDDEGNIDREAMAEAAWKTHLESLVKCEKCGRTFFPDRLMVHQKSCMREA
ncbi:uncharacterized protein [Panulirus ornatus]|uniref:uncharacterized protein isoform X3 n=1 Tax=Panulirus ornatus TaxID=150431 RepID=UPI003A868FA4